MAISKITSEQKALLKRASVHALSTRPGEQGKKEEDIKNAMYVPVEMVAEFINDIVDSANSEISDVAGDVANLHNTEFKSDSITTVIDYELESNVAMSFKAEATSVTLTIPSGIDAGFNCEVIFHTGTTAPSVTFVNNSGLTLAKLQFGALIGSYNPPSNAIVNIYFCCSDGEIVKAVIIDIK